MTSVMELYRDEVESFHLSREGIGMLPKFEVYRDKAGEFRFRLLAGNGEIILASESYKEKRSAFNGIASIKKNCVIPERYVRKNGIDGRPYFLLKAANHEAIGKSQSYEAQSGVESGISSVLACAPEAEVLDLTKRQKKTVSI